MIVAESGASAWRVIVSHIDLCWIKTQSRANGLQNGFLPGPYLEKRLRLSSGRQPRDEVLLALGEESFRDVPPSHARIDPFNIDAYFVIKGYRVERESL